MKELLRKDLKTLTNIISVDGREEEMAAYLKERLEGVCDEFEILPRGTVIAKVKGKTPGRRMAICAHQDEIGMMVKNITEEGFILFEKVGDFSDKIIPSRRVLVQAENNKRVVGVIGMRAAHLLTAEEAVKAQTTGQSYIDVGATSKEEVLSYGIQKGDRIVFDSEYIELENRDKIVARAIDNKAGVAVAINILENLDREKLEGEVVGVFSVLEETTIAGGISAITYVDPDYVIVIDTVPCGDVPDIDTEKELPVYQEKGPTLILAMGTPCVEKFSCMHSKIKKAFINTASKNNIPIQELVLSEKFYITDEVGMMLAGKGVPVGTIAMPRRYSHSPIELISLNDLVKEYELLTSFIYENNGNLDLNFI